MRLIVGIWGFCFTDEFRVSVISCTSCLPCPGSTPGGRTIWPGPRTGSTKRMMVFYTLSPHHRELAGIPFAPAPAGGPGRLCACALLFFVLRGGDCGKPAYRQTEKENSR